ncbi:MAG: dicarboxylate/amino acid:cation symporter [Candidatus Symbiodolus clandestinus]
MKLKFPLHAIRPLLYSLALLLGILSGLSTYTSCHLLASTIADLFIKLFKLVSLPLFSLSLIVTLGEPQSTTAAKSPWRRTLCYTLGTTLIAASLSCLLYVIIQPPSMADSPAASTVASPPAIGYEQHLLTLIPDSLLAPFIEQQIMGVLFLALLLGVALRSLPSSPAQTTLLHFFQGLHQVLIIISRWIIAWLPLGLFGFVSVALLQARQGALFLPLSCYLLVIIAANLLQGGIILPIWLWWNRLPPWATFKAMLPALSVAFFSKSSSATLPITIEMAEQRLKIAPAISRFVLPLCTTINMNGCAAFIFTTVIYLMQNQGVVITPATLLLWIVIATVAAIGNAGVPMGCFFLSTALLTSMDVPIALLGMILPFYTVIDMLETALNVWSDSCVTAVVNQKTRAECHNG